jgi:adenylate kinase family enzyme
MHKYIIMGVQGCGKGTQARLLKESFDLVHLTFRTPLASTHTFFRSGFLSTGM